MSLFDDMPPLPEEPQEKLPYPPHIKEQKDGQILVTFNEQNESLIKQHGDARQAIKERHGIEGKSYGSKLSGSKFHRIGVAAELAVAAYLKVPPNLKVTVRGTKGVSLTVKDHKINVKHNSTGYGDLRFDVDKVPDVEYIVLTKGDWEKGLITIVGWITRDRFIEEKGESILGENGPKWLLPAWRLAPMRDLLIELGLMPKQETLF